MTEKNWPTAIDPAGCGCTECITGEYVPLEQASHAQVVDMLLGKLGNHLYDWTNEHTQLQVTVVIGDRPVELPPEQSARLLKQRVAERNGDGRT